MNKWIPIELNKWWQCISNSKIHDLWYRFQIIDFTEKNPLTLKFQVSLFESYQGQLLPLCAEKAAFRYFDEIQIPHETEETWDRTVSPWSSRQVTQIGLLKIEPFNQCLGQFNEGMWFQFAENQRFKILERTLLFFWMTIFFTNSIINSV